MARSAKQVGGLVVLAVACYAGHASAQTSPVRVGVRLVNAAAVEAGTLENAKQLVARLFAEGGVELVWAGAPSGASAPDLRLTVFLNTDSYLKAQNTSDVFGAAIVPAVGCGRIAYVMWDRIQSFARGEGVPASIVLGPVVAHEIGHLLLGSQAHSPDGIMQAQWRPRDFLTVLSGQSGFSREQSERMRGQLSREPSLSPRR